MAEAKKKIGGKAFGWMFNSEEETESKPSAQASAPQAATAVMTAPTTSATIPATVDPKIIEALTQKVNEKNLPGYDYLELINGINAMATIVPDELSRFKAAFAAASAMGVTKEKILDSIVFYLKVLEEESASFNSQFDERAADNEKKNIQLKGLESQINENTKKILALTEENTKLKDQGITITNQMIEEKNKIQSVKDRFLVSYNALKQTFTSHKEKITQYI